MSLEERQTGIFTWIQVNFAAAPDHTYLLKQISLKTVYEWAVW